MNRWQEHFQSVLNCPEPTVAHECPEYHITTSYMDSISEAEVRMAVKQLKNGKAAGTDSILPELFKAADFILPYLTRVCNMVWQHEATTVDWKNGIIIPLPKNGDLTECSNWWGITLLSVLGKVFARILLNCMKNAVDQLFWQQQACFRPRNSCMDQIFSLRQIIKQTPIMKVRSAYCHWSSSCSFIHNCSDY